MNLLWDWLEGPGTHSACSFVSWLVVSTPLKNISQMGLLFPIYMEKICSKPPTSFCLDDRMSLLHRFIQVPHSSTRTRPTFPCLGIACRSIDFLHAKRCSWNGSSTVWAGFTLDKVNTIESAWVCLELSMRCTSIYPNFDRENEDQAWHSGEAYFHTGLWMFLDPGKHSNENTSRVWEFPSSRVRAEVRLCLTSNIDSMQQFYWITVTSSLCAATNLVSNSQLGFHNVFALFCYIVYFFHNHNQDVARHESNKAIQLILPRFCTTKIYLTLIWHYACRCPFPDCQLPTEGYRIWAHKT